MMIYEPLLFVGIVTHGSALYNIHGRADTNFAHFKKVHDGAHHCQKWIHSHFSH